MNTGPSIQILSARLALASRTGGTVPVAPPPDHGPYKGLFVWGTGLVTIRLGDHQQTIELPKDGQAYTISAAWGSPGNVRYTVTPA